MAGGGSIGPMDADREQEIHQLVEDGAGLTGLSMEDLGYIPDPEDLTQDERDAMEPEDLEWLQSVSPDRRAQSLHQARMLAGTLWQASARLVEHLFEDIATVRHQEIVTVGSIDDTWVLSALPRQFATHYDARFAQRFLVVTVDMTASLIRGWEAPSCLAQELAVRSLLNEAEETAAVYNLDLPQDWRRQLEDLLLEDTETELLYRNVIDGVEENGELKSRLGLALMRVDSWFEPFNVTRHVPPYAR